MTHKITISQCYDGAFVGGEAVEVAVHDSEGVRYYLVGQELEHGETMVAPYSLAERRITARWTLADHSVLDAIEALQSMEDCRACDGDGIVEEVSRHDLADVREQACDDCDGRGWL